MFVLQETEEDDADESLKEVQIYKYPWRYYQMI